MTKKKLAETIKQIKDLKKKNDQNKLEEVVKPFIQDLNKDKNYEQIVTLFTNILDPGDPGYYEFETAFAFNEMRKYQTSEEIYNLLLHLDDENISILNNLSNIKKTTGEISEAFELIEKAYELTKGKDEIVTRNYSALLQLMTEKKEAEHLFTNAKEELIKETKWALSKLEYFLVNVAKDPTFKEGKIPIARWKFKILMGVDDEKADSLRDQWIKKGYIRTLNERADRGVLIYEINPQLRVYLKEVKPIELNNEWFSGIENINRDKLKQCDYFLILEKIEKVGIKYRAAIKRDYDELVFNYLLGSKKSTIILAGSFLELLFIYECEKKKISSLSYMIGIKVVTKNLLDCGLADFLSFFEEKKSLKPVIVSLGNVTRIYRNFIHPGNEIKNKENLDNSKVEICFHSATQIAKYLLKVKSNL